MFKVPWVKHTIHHDTLWDMKNLLPHWFKWYGERHSSMGALSRNKDNWISTVCSRRCAHSKSLEGSWREVIYFNIGSTQKEKKWHYCPLLCSIVLNVHCIGWRPRTNRCKAKSSPVPPQSRFDRGRHWSLDWSLGMAEGSLAPVQSHRFDRTPTYWTPTLRSNTEGQGTSSAARQTND